MELKDIKTYELVEELKRREGVEVATLDNHEDVCEVGNEIYTGPGTTILIIGD